MDNPSNIIHGVGMIDEITPEPQRPQPVPYKPLRRYYIHYRDTQRKHTTIDSAEIQFIPGAGVVLFADKHGEELFYVPMDVIHYIQSGGYSDAYPDAPLPKYGGMSA